MKLDPAESTRRARKTSLKKRARDRRRALAPGNQLKRARSGANSGLSSPTRRGVLRQYGDNE